jgi:hypothetical protein
MVHVGVVTDPRQLVGDGNGRQHEVGRHRRALGHAGVLRGFCVLDERDASFRLDRSQAERAVRSCPRQHHADGAPLPLSGERAEEVIDRRVTVDRGARREREDAARDRDVSVRRDHVDVVGLHASTVGDRDDGHRRGPRQHLG